MALIDHGQGAVEVALDHLLKVGGDVDLEGAAFFRGIEVEARLHRSLGFGDGLLGGVGGLHLVVGGDSHVRRQEARPNVLQEV